MRNDDCFREMVNLLFTNMKIIGCRRSQFSTIRKLRTTNYNQKQARLRNKIVDYATKNKITPQEIEEWLFRRTYCN
jgi:hypothetical protein